MGLAHDILMQHLPPKRRVTPMGWILFNSPCCEHNGHRPDTRMRGNLKINPNGQVDRARINNLLQLWIGINKCMTHIYASTKTVPYVYICTHLQTKEFYIGYREANTLPSHLDLPEYRTSSKVVHPFFENYEWLIVAEFMNGEDAYDFEQKLIQENWGDPLLINKQYRVNGTKKFRCRPIGKRDPRILMKIAESRRKNKKPPTPEQIQNYSKGQKKRYQDSTDTAETREKKSVSHRGRYDIESPDGRKWTTDLGLKEFAEIHADEIGVSYWALFNAYRKSYGNTVTTRITKITNNWKVTRLDKSDN